MNSGMSKEEAVSVNQSHVWELVCKELDYQIENVRDSLESARNPDDIAEAQARLRALRGLLRLPQDVIDREGE